MTARKTVKAKVQFLYALSRHVNGIAVLAERKGSGEVGQLVEDMMDFVAANIGLKADYKDRVDDWQLINGGLQEALEMYPEKE